MFSALKKLVGLSSGYDGSLTSEDINFSFVDHYGLIGEPACFSFDPVLQVLAVAGVSGLIKLYGTVSAEVTLHPARTVVPRELYILPSNNLLLVIYDGYVDIWSIKERKVTSTISLPAAYSSSAHIQGSVFVYIGLTNGQTVVVHAEKGQLSQFTITLGDLDLQSEADVMEKLGESRDWRVSALAVNPEAQNLLLIGFLDARIIEFDITIKKPKHKYVALSGSKHQLTALAWHSFGEKFLSGHSTGEIFMWKHRKDKFERDIILSKSEKKKPVKRLFYTSSGPNKLWCALGGTGEDEPSCVVFEMGKEKQHFMLPLSDRPGAAGDAINIQLVFNDPHSNASDPTGIIAISQSGQLQIFGLSPAAVAAPVSPRGSPSRPTPTQMTTSPFIKLPLPPPLPLQQSPVQQSLLVNCSAALLADLRKVCNVAWDNTGDRWPLRGGSFQASQVTISKLLITVHEDCVVRFFDVSIRAVIMLYELQLPFELTKDQRDGLTPKPIATTLAFCQQSRQLSVGMTDGSVFLYVFSLKDNATPSIAEWPAPAAQPAPLATTSSPAPESNPSDSANPMATSSTGDATAAAAAAPADTPKTPVPEDAQKPSGAPSIVLAQYRGFQLICKWQLGQPISTISLESALGLVALGTFRGAAYLFGVKYHQGESRTSSVEQVFANVPPPSPTTNSASADQLSPVVQMRFMETALEKYGAVILVVIARENGSVYIVNLKNLAAGAGRALTGRDAATNESNKNFVPQLINFYLTTERGRQLSLPKRLWITDEEQPKTSETSASTGSASAEPTKPASPQPGPSSPSESPELFMVMVFVNCIITYRIPAFEKAELIQTKAPLAWCCPIRVTKADQDECCLVCVDMGCNLHFHNLMSLKAHEKSYSLRSVGVETNLLFLKIASGSGDGVFWFFSPHMEALRCSLFPRFTEGPLAVAEFHKDSVQLPMRKKSQASGLKGFMGGSMHKDVNLEEIFKVEPKQAISSSSSSSSGQPAAQLDERAAREKLLGSGAASSRQLSGQDKAKQVGSQTNELKGTLEETRDRLNERGRRLEDLGQRTQEMENEARNFADMAKKLSEQNKKKWYQL
eukprot:TRINITY_DN826_c0_g2_i2.p1 TRINITY_DN826_c0_g2~~TRINITY_DN826_c0_g2_i2.p1  ORF type:complete len:1083 (+),score=170.75 TRINITY_DN826_c0_g2_i2:41-3289(+)